MKKATLLLLLAMAFAGCKKDDTPEKEVDPDTEQPVEYETVNIGGTEWMLYNLANPRQAEGGATFATKLPSQCPAGTRLESHGKLYQWGINVAWNTTGSSASGATPSGSWNTSTARSDWTDQPCPKGYRLPTDEEFKNLLNNTTASNGGGWSEDDYGYKTFASKGDSSKSLEFPAVGGRNSNGSLSEAGKSGNYWSSAASILTVNDSDAGLQSKDVAKQLGQSIRCVKGTPGSSDPDDPDDTEDPDKKIDPYATIEIGGTEWMPLNLANPKQASGGATFATKLPSQCSGTRAESHGKFYQWGINVAWNTLGESINGATPSGSWNTSESPFHWDHHPCPEGYRLPTDTEFENLRNSSTVSRGGGWSSSDYGYIKFTSGSNSVEFPAVGYRYSDSSGTLRSNVGANGNYWSSVDYAYAYNFAYCLWFTSSDLGVKHNYKQQGFSVRCVKRVPSDPNPVDPDEEIDPFSTIEIGGTEWMPLNLANPKQASGGATFATKLPSQCSGTRSESHGKFYQWGINVAWNTTGSSASGATPGGSWNTSTYPDNWNTHPCPDGYRLPTKDEFQSLINSSTVSRHDGWYSSDYGSIKFSSGSNSVEFPAVGFRTTDGTLNSNSNMGAGGYYWSSVDYGSNYAYTLHFTSGSLYMSYSNKQFGFSVRCVKGNTNDTSDPDDPDGPNTGQPVQYETVNIADTEWMLYNLANTKQASGGATFATKLPSQCSSTRAESHGKFYQWGINVAWNTTGSLGGATPSGSWNTTNYPNNWNTHPCPDGYRLPTKDEFHALINGSTVSHHGGWDSSDYGYIKVTSGSNSVEFPAVGYRYYSDGTLNRAGTSGYYWSSVADGSSYAYYLWFNSSGLGVSNGYDKRYGHSVRCVKGENAKPVDPDKEINPLNTIEIGGTKWMPLNLANPKQVSGGATFATKLPSQCSGTRAESRGKLYQWGINVAWNTTVSWASGATPSGSWNTSTYPDNWNTHPCPEGYRLPTNTEFKTLINSSTVSRDGGWSSSDYGYIKFTSGSNSVEFPAVGWRGGSDGTLYDAGTGGYYWSSVANGSKYAYGLWFDSSDLRVNGGGDKRNGFSVRCVRQ